MAISKNTSYYGIMDHESLSRSAASCCFRFVGDQNNNSSRDNRKMDADSVGSRISIAISAAVLLWPPHGAPAYSYCGMLIFQVTVFRVPLGKKKDV